MNNCKETPQQLFSKGSALLRAGNSAAAWVCFQNLLKVEPSEPTVNLFAGAVLHDLCRYDEAIRCYQQTIRQAPHLGEAHNNIANSYLALGQFKEAADSFTRAMALLPTSPVPLTARATALQALGHISAAEADCRRALEMAPEFAVAHWNLALNLLLQGRYEEGWREYEWRWRKTDFTSPVRHPDIPLWDGSALKGRTILLHAEQGFGDAIQFVRYAPLIARLGGNVLLECHPELVSLFKGVEGVQTTVPFGSPLPPPSYQAPLLSLPRICGTRLENIPSTCPYLTTTAERRRKWSLLMAAYPAQIRVGLVWAGKSYPDPLRSCRLSDLAPLASGSNATFFSLQLGIGSEEANVSPAGMRLINLTDQICDFADSAAMMEHLDLIICIDTAVAHLAGAMGRPAWLLLPFAPDWRWMLKRADSPWYPTMRIFRQERQGEWGKAVDQVNTALQQEFYPKQKIL